MARLPYLDEADLKPEDRDLLKRPINLHRMHAHSPGMARPFTAPGPSHPIRQHAGSAPSGTGNPAGRLPDQKPV